MLLETTAQQITWYSILAMLMPVIVVVVKYILNLDKTQKLAQKTGHQGLIEDLADTAISAAEKWAKNQVKEGGEKPASADKKSYAISFLMRQAKQYGVPEELLRSEVVLDLIEALLNDREP